MYFASNPIEKMLKYLKSSRDLKIKIIFLIQSKKTNGIWPRKNIEN